jgi:hypothetical protein
MLLPGLSVGGGGLTGPGEGTACAKLTALRSANPALANAARAKKWDMMNSIGSRSKRYGPVLGSVISRSVGRRIVSAELTWRGADHSSRLVASSRYIGGWATSTGRWSAACASPQARASGQ